MTNDQGAMLAEMHAMATTDHGLIKELVAEMALLRHEMRRLQTRVQLVETKPGGE